MSTTPASPINAAPSALSQEDKARLITSNEWSDSDARTIVLSDWRKADNYMVQNHYRRFQTSMELFLAWVQKRTWEGTRIPRASAPIFIAYEQIMALLASTMAVIMEGNTLPFRAFPMAGTTPQQARAVEDLLKHQLSNLGMPGKFFNIRGLMEGLHSSSYIFGNGIAKFCWLESQEEKELWSRVSVPERTMIDHPELGPIPVPTGNMVSYPQLQRVTVRTSKPVVQLVDVRDFLIDPNCPSPSPQDAGYAMTRHLPTVADVIQMLSDMERSGVKVNIPSTAKLMELASRKPSTISDNTKQSTETYRGGFWQPNQDQSEDPRLARIELIHYYQKDHEVIMLGREFIALNGPNYYGMIPFLNTCYSDVPGRFYGLSICDLVEGDQRLAEAIINKRIDELNLAIHPPLVKKRGISFPQTMTRMRPGVVWEVDSPKDDLIILDRPPVNAGAYVEVEALERRVQKTTGITDLATLGTPSSGGNSANRTATGVNTQVAATGKRIQYQCEKTENNTLIPLLHVLLSLNQKCLDPAEFMKITGIDGTPILIDPLDILNSSVGFEMQGSGKAKMRQQMLLGGGLQQIYQAYFNPAFVGLLNQAGYTLNAEEFDALTCDTMSLPRKGFLRPLTPQEMAKLNQPDAKTQMQLQLQQERLAAMAQQQESSDDTQILIALLSKMLTPEVAHAALAEVGLDTPLKLTEKSLAKPPAKA